MPGPNTNISFVDGTLDFSGGVHSLKLRTAQSERTPNGLARNELAWLINARIRDGGIYPRTGWDLLGGVHDGSARFQGGFLYEPVGADPYLILSIGGHIYQVTIDPFVVVNLSLAFGLINSADQERCFFVQAEEFLIIQAGDNVTLPLFWDGNTLRRSIGITDTAVAPGTPGVNEIPAATAMDYYMGRIWYAQGRRYFASDIVNGPSGTAPYGFRDSILNVTENPLVIGGDGFILPAFAGDIRAIKHSSLVDAALGQGRLFIFTRKSIFSLQVPVTRADWIASDSQNQPLQTVIQQVNGAVSDWAIVPVNGDLFFRSLEPGIRSLILAVRDFNQWGNVDLSADVRRALQYDDRALLRFSSGIEFDNRLIMTALPKETEQGVVFQALIPLDFMPVSTLENRRPPKWEGMYQGRDWLQLFNGDYGGRERAFGLAVSLTGAIELLEMTFDGLRDSGDSRIQWIAEFPAFTGGEEAMLKRLMSAELWIDRLWGTVFFKLEYRPDGENCWLPWHQFQLCSPRNPEEAGQEDDGYPDATEFGEGYSQPVVMPKPPAVCQDQVGRPSDIGYQFQVRLTVRGNARLRGLLLHLTPLERGIYSGMPVCEFAEFPNVAIETTHDLTQFGGTLEAEEEIEPPVIEEDVMPLEHAIYDASRNVIWGVFKGMLHKFDGDSGELLQQVQVQSFYHDGFTSIALASNDKLYVSWWRDPNYGLTDGGFGPYVAGFPTKATGFFVIDPDTLALDSSIGWSSLIGTGDASAFLSGPRHIIAVGSKIIGVLRAGTTGGGQENRLFVFDISDPAGTFRQSAGVAPHSAWTDLAHNPNCEVLDINPPNNNLAVNGIFFFSDSSDARVYCVDIDTTFGGDLTNWATLRGAGDPDYGFFGVASPIGLGKVFVTTRTQFLYRFLIDETPDFSTPGPGGRTEIDTGVDMEPVRIRYNPYDQMSYIADQKNHKIVVFDPATELVSREVSGFKYPVDFVFTPTKTFAVQLGGKALKEVT
jgi:hypothetical protein